MSSSLRVVRSNRTEALVAGLHAAIRTPLPDPFQKELIVVQGRGMGQWLSMELARRASVFANAEFLFPKHFVERAFCWVLGERHEPDVYTRDQLTWAVAALLPTLLTDPAFEQLQRYLKPNSDDSASPDGLRLFQLASRIAQAFDDYLTYRPDLLKKWERPEEHFSDPQLSLFGQPPSADPAVWQRRLWRSVVKLLGSGHAATREQQFTQAIKKLRIAGTLPTRISAFGLSTLPPQYQRVLLQLARCTEVTLYQLSPCREFFADMAVRAEVTAPGAMRDNRLLQVYARVAAQFERSLAELREAAQDPEHDAALYGESPGETVLERLQNDILDLRDGPTAQKLPSNLFDGSVRINVCHSPTRELEVLHNDLLELIAVKGIKPHEIVVMMPDVDAYAPLIESVFDRPHDDEKRIPYRISDRNLKGESPILDALYRTLGLAHQRLNVAEVLDLLGLPTVHQKFEIAATELHLVTEWVIASGIRWGIDAEHKTRFGVAPVEQNTWRFGLRRLLLGYSTKSTDFPDVAGSVPSDLVEGKAGILLGKFAHFVEVLISFVQQLEQARSMSDWRVVCSALVQALFHADDANNWQTQGVLSALSSMDAAATRAEFAETFNVQTFGKLLEQHFDAHRGARGFLSGGVTFCALVPMRSIPFHVVYLVGMNEAAFPRTSRRPDFNLLDAPDDQRLCDPNRRDEDRYLFLEAILAARKRLVVSYVGQSIRDNQFRAPSAVVSELVEYLTEQYQLAKKPSLNPLFVFHPLQPFSPRYFNASSPSLFSYEAAYLAGAKQVNAERSAKRAFFTKALPAVDLPRELPLRELQNFFANPVGFLLRRRLGLYIEDDSLEIPQREPLTLTPLEHYKLGDFALRHLRGSLSEEHCFRTVNLQGEVPAGNPGQYEFLTTLGTVRPLLDRLEQLCGAEPPSRVDLRIHLSSQLSVFGSVPGVYADKVVGYQYSRLSAKSRLKYWLQHLALCSSSTSTNPQVSYLLGRQTDDDNLSVAVFRPVANAIELLSDLVTLFHQGLCWPMPFLPDTSELCAKNKSYNHKWSEELRNSSALRQVYADVLEPREIPAPPADSAMADEFQFEKLAKRIFEPMFQHLVLE